MQTELAHLVREGKRAYLIGIGGVGMSALGRILASRGLEVIGSDAKKSKTTCKLESEGIQITIGHDTSSIERADWVIYSSAIAKTNPEFLKAKANGIPIYHRAEVLSFLMNQVISLAITGAHGKTTSSALTSFLMTQAGLRPTCFVGGEILNYRSNVVLGDPHLFVAEVDESDRSQLYYEPDFALITNLDAEHLDVYKDINDIKSSFRVFVEQIKTTGKVVYCAEDLHLREITLNAPSAAISYGWSDAADFWAKDVVLEGLRSTYTLVERGVTVNEVNLSIPGLHNVLNSLGVIALLRSFGLRYEQFLKFIPDFKGTSRRLEVKLISPDHLILDDYAHHPTEIDVTLRAIHALGKKTTVVFQPHRFSRTQHLAHEFSNVFRTADKVLLTEIYSAGETNLNGVDATLIYNAVKKSGHPNVRMIKRDEIINFLMANHNDNEVIAFLGAGDIGEIADEFASRFENAYTD